MPSIHTKTARRKKRARVSPDGLGMNIGVLRFDRTAALIDGRVQIENVNVVNVPGGKTGVQGLLSGGFEGADVPFIKYVLWKAAGKPITAIPVFTDRLFQHQYIYTRTDTGIKSLADLRGRRVICAPSYFSTPTFWTRALIEEAGVPISSIEWYSAGKPDDGVAYPEALNVKVAPASWLGLERLIDGTADCLITARTARIPAAGRAESVGLWTTPTKWIGHGRSAPAISRRSTYSRSTGVHLLRDRRSPVSSARLSTQPRPMAIVSCKTNV
jgi:hypothetical protein